jgi:hypothetical protein
VRKQNAVGSWIVAVIVVLAVVVAGAYIAHKAMQPGHPVPATAAASASTDTNATVAAAPIQHPISQATPASASTAPLPALDGSDDNVVSALESLTGPGDLATLLVRQQIVQRIVATIDALPRRGLGIFMLPVHLPKGSFVTAGGASGTVVGEGNAARYEPYMRVIEHVDTKALVAWYVHAYPLFQEAYRQLGYPKGYFNDRLIVVIDNLLDTPELVQPATLVSSKSFYVYTDPALESLSIGQKLLLRLGPANETKLKAKLRMIRAELVGQTLPGTGSSSATP